MFSASAQVQTNQVFTNLPVPAVLAPDVTRIALIEHYALTESSGFAASRQHRNVFWSHNDTGDPMFLFALNRQGEHLGAFEIQGANLIDLEAIAFDELNRLYLADTGTNGMIRSHAAIHRVAEPTPAVRWGPARVERSWFIRFPGPREDCEAMFIHDGFAYLISKYAPERRVTMYRFNPADESSSILLEIVGTIPVPDNVSDASISADKARLALLTSDGVVVLFINGDPLTAPTARRQTTRYEHPLVEGSAIIQGGVLVTTELSREILFFANPDVFSGAPRIVTGLTNRSAFVGDTVTFEAEIEGFPAPTIEWRFDGQLIPGATNTSLVLTNLSLTNAGVYEIVAVNPEGTARSSATLTVSERIVDLRVTEIMSSQAPGQDREDWWELTSFDSVTRDLSGWRFNDVTGDLSDAFVIPAGTVIRPGESIVFVEDMNAEQFRAWWGETNVPPNVQIVTYTGAALSFNAVRDQLRLWDAATTDPAATFRRVDIGAATSGVSFTRDPASGEMVNSQLGVNGAFQAVSGGDVASPGFYVIDSGVRLEGTLRGAALQLKFPVAPTQVYSIEQSDTLAPGNWRTVIQGVQGPGTGDILFQRSLAVTNRFFRLRVEERQ